MQSRDFCYWLMGILEGGRATSLDEEQVKIIRKHLNLVFVHEIDGPDPDGKLQAVHDGTSKPPHPNARPPGSGVARC